jgi:hypothetical protein
MDRLQRQIEMLVDQIGWDTERITELECQVEELRNLVRELSSDE